LYDVGIVLALELITRVAIVILSGAIWNFFAGGNTQFALLVSAKGGEFEAGRGVKLAQDYGEKVPAVSAEYVVKSCPRVLRRPRARRDC
jgi:hypothetical protein